MLISCSATFCHAFFAYLMRSICIRLLRRKIRHKERADAAHRHLRLRCPFQAGLFSPTSPVDVKSPCSTGRIRKNPAVFLSKTCSGPDEWAQDHKGRPKQLSAHFPQQWPSDQSARWTQMVFPYARRAYQPLAPSPLVWPVEYNPSADQAAPQARAM